MAKSDSKNDSPPRGQKSLTSFFGAARSSKTGEAVAPRKRQSSLKSGLRKQAASAAPGKSDDAPGPAKSAAGAEGRPDGAPPPAGGSGKHKENVENDEEAEAAGTKAPCTFNQVTFTKSADLMDTDDEEDAKAPAARRRSAAAESSRRKRVIDDDDSDSDDDDVKVGDLKREDGGPAKSPEEPAAAAAELEEESAESDDEDAYEEPASGAEDPMDEDSEPDEDGGDDEKPRAKKQRTLGGGAVPAPRPRPPAKAGSKSAQSASNKKSNEALAGAMRSEKDWDGAGGKGDGSVPYSALASAFEAIEGVTGKLDRTEILADLFRKVLLRDGGGGGGHGWCDPPSAPAGGPGTKKRGGRSDLYTLLYLSSNAVAPKHENVELGVGDSILVKAIGEASGTKNGTIKSKYEEEGDLGDVAMSCKGRQKTLMFGAGPRRLGCGDVLGMFKEIANTSGSQSQKWKVDTIKKLLVRAKGNEPKFIIRGLQGKLRIGLAQSTVLAAIAQAVVLTSPRGVELTEERMEEIRALDGTDDAYPELPRRLCENNLPLSSRIETAEAIIKKAYCQVPSFDALLDALLTVPLTEIHNSITLLPGIPVVPMLAKPTKSILDVLKRLNGLRFTCEYKYDGERAQVHCTPGGETKVFSRNLLDTTEKFPEVPLYVRESCGSTDVKSFVLDTEVVAFNRETGQFVPFQVLSTRKKTEESAESAKVQVIVQAFDLMYLNGESLLDRPLSHRRELLHKNFLPVEGKFQYATALDHTEDGETAVIEEFLDAAVKGQCEGLMVKTLDVNAVYEPDRRSLNWLKLKKDYLEGLGDSVDLVPLGAYHGRGKRTGVYGAYLLACYDYDTEEFQSVCKIGTGFSEEDLKSLAADLKGHVIPEKSSQYVVSDTLACDVWFDAVRVWEVKAADLSKSSTHKGAIDKTGDAGRGIGLRFPRFERVRPDKKPEQATSSDQILEMYYNQDSVIDKGGGGDDDGI